MIYIWRIPDDYPESLIGEYVKSDGPDRFLFRRGERLPVDVGVPVIRFSAPLKSIRQYTCLPNNAMLPIVGKDLSEVLYNYAPEDVQMFPVKIQSQDGISDDYCLLNIATKIVGLDKSRCDLNFIPGTDQIMSFRHLSYFDDCLGSHSLARDSEYLAHILVSGGLVNTMLANHVTGVDFVTPEKII